MPMWFWWDRKSETAVNVIFLKPLSVASTCRIYRWYVRISLTFEKEHKISPQFICNLHWLYIDTYSSYLNCVLVINEMWNNVSKFSLYKSDMNMIKQARIQSCMHYPSPEVCFMNGHVVLTGV